MSIRVQRVRNEAGEIIGYRSQPRHPLTGRQVSVTGKTEGEVMRRVLEIQQLRRDRAAGASPEQITSELGRRVMRPKSFTERWKDFEAVHSASSGFQPRLSAWRTRIEPHFGKRAPAELTAVEMGRWQAELRKTYAQKSIIDAYWLLAALVRQAIEAGELTAYPWSKWKPEPPDPGDRIGAGTWEEWTALVNAALAHSRERWERGTYDDVFQAVVVMGLTGLRQAEAAGLAWECLDLDGAGNQVMTVRYQARKGWEKRSRDGRPRDLPKAKRARSQVLHPTVVDVLRRHATELERRGWYRFDGPVFPVHRGEWRKSGTVLRTSTIQAIVRAAGLEGSERWSGHSLRHTFCSLEANAGTDIRRVQQRAGHADVKVTMGYVHAGRVLPASPLPKMDIMVETPLLAPVGAAETAPENATAQRAAMRRERDRVKRAQEKTDSEASFAEVAFTWANQIHADDDLPKQVRAAMRRAYVRGYVTAQRKNPEGGTAAWKKAGNHAKHATLGAWKKALGRARADLENAPLYPVSEATQPSV